MKISSKIRYEFNRRFANGEQYISYDCLGKIMDDLVKQYYWQERETYNHILPIIEMLKAKYKNKITSKFLYGENGLVEMLIPTQRAYNNLMNRSVELVNRLSNPCLKVEDGSVDIDAIEDDGLVPGKVLVYRQGSIPPTIMEFNDGSLSNFNKEQQMLLKEFEEITKLFELKVKETDND